MPQIKKKTVIFVNKHLFNHEQVAHHCPEETNSVTSDSNDLDMWNRPHTANEGIRYNQESVKHVYFGRLL